MKEDSDFIRIMGEVVLPALPPVGPSRATRWRILQVGAFFGSNTERLLQVCPDALITVVDPWDKNEGEGVAYSEFMCKYGMNSRVTVYKLPFSKFILTEGGGFPSFALAYIDEYCHPDSLLLHLFLAMACCPSVIAGYNSHVDYVRDVVGGFQRHFIWKYKLHVIGDQWALIPR